MRTSVPRRTSLRFVVAPAIGVAQPVRVRAQSADAVDQATRAVTASRASSTLQGFPARFFVAHDSGRNRGSSTWSTLNLTAPTPDLQLQVTSHAGARDGEVVEVDTNDPAFDRAYLVEGAPVDLVRALLDAPMQCCGGAGHCARLSSLGRHRGLACVQSSAGPRGAVACHRARGDASGKSNGGGYRSLLACFP